MIYDTRNMNNINKLADNTKRAALAWYVWCKENKVEILIYDTLRSPEKQKENIQNGSSQTMRSYHLVGQALDFVPVDAQGRCLWDGYNKPLIQKAIKKAKEIGFKWGGDWTSFRDSPHLEFWYKGYGTDTFNKQQVNYIHVSTPQPVKYTSIVDYLKSKGMNASFAARQQLAKRYGINDYRGTAAQNTLLLQKLQG